MQPNITWVSLTELYIKTRSYEELLLKLITFEGKSTNKINVFSSFDALGSKDGIARFRTVISFRQINKDKSIKANQVHGIADDMTESMRIAYIAFQNELKNHLKQWSTK